MPHDGMRQSRRAARPRVLVVDDHAPMLEHAALTLQEEFTVVARAARCGVAAGPVAGSAA